MVDAERRDHHRLENLKKRLENVIENSPVLKSFRPQLLIDMTTEGLRIQIIDKEPPHVRHRSRRGAALHARTSCGLGPV